MGRKKRFAALGLVWLMMAVWPPPRPRKAAYRQGERIAHIQTATEDFSAAFTAPGDRGGPPADKTDGGGAPSA